VGLDQGFLDFMGFVCCRSKGFSVGFEIHPSTTGPDLVWILLFWGFGDLTITHWTSVNTLADDLDLVMVGGLINSGEILAK
jgi:hypothetical protein